MEIKRENNKNTINKGDYNYLKKNKIIHLSISFVLIFITMIIFYTGYFKYGNTKNVFTVLAAVSVIPMAKFIVGYIVIAKYKSITDMEYSDLNETIESELLYDLIISSADKVYNARVTIVRDNSVYLYIPEQRTSKNVIEKYIRTFLETECKVTTVRVFNTLEEFKNMAVKLAKNEPGKFDEKIKKLLLIYSL